MRFAVLAVLAAGTTHAASLPPRIKSVVRADSRGRLVRTFVVSPRATKQAVPVMENVPQLIEAAAKRHNVDPLLVHSVIQVESNYNPYAVSPKGAQGLMQLMPGTATRFGVRNTFDPKENIEGGVRYLKYLTSLFPGKPSLILAAYNAGEGAVWKYGNSVPPYRETEQYVQRVGEKYGKAVRDAAKSQAKSGRSVEVAPGTEESPEPENPYASVQAFLDADGRLHMRNATTASGSSPQTP